MEQIEEMVSQVQGGHVNGDGNANGDTGVDGHQVVSMSVSSGQQRPLGEQTTSQEKVIEHEKAGTPTDVRDVHF